MSQVVIAIAEQNFNPEKLKQVICSFDTGLNASALANAAAKGNLNDFVEKNLRPEQKAEIQRMLSDKKAVEQILASPQAQRIMKMLNKEK